MVDFDAMVKGLSAAGAFEPYPQGFHLSQKMQQHFDGDLRPVHFKGEFSHVRGAALLSGLVEKFPERFLGRDLGIPSAIVERQKQSIVGALRIYMQHEPIQQHLSQLIRDPVWVTGDLGRLLFSANVPQTLEWDVGNNKYLPAHLSFNHDTTERTASVTKFTKLEAGFIWHELHRDPMLPIAIKAYQAGLLDYLTEFDDAVKRSSVLTDKEKSIASMAIKNLSGPIGSSTFSMSIIPVLGLRMASRRLDDIDAVPDANDFTSSMQFMACNNMFQQTVAGQTFRCPAQAWVSSSSAKAVENADADQTRNIWGHAFYCIYKALQNSISEDTKDRERSKIVAIQNKAGVPYKWDALVEALRKVRPDFPVNSRSETAIGANARRYDGMRPS